MTACKAVEEEEDDDDAGELVEMSKLYIGNLAAEANEAALRQLLADAGVGAVTSVLVKRGGYAFVDCPEQATVERAIEKLNGNESCQRIFFPFNNFSRFLFFSKIESFSL